MLNRHLWVGPMPESCGLASRGGNASEERGAGRPVGLVAGWPLLALRTFAGPNSGGPLGPADGRRGTQTGEVPGDRIPVASRKLLSGRPLGHVRLERLGARGNLRLAVPGCLRGSRSADIHSGWRLSPLAARWKSGLLSFAGLQARGG